MLCSLTGRMYLLRHPARRLRRRVSYRAPASRTPLHDGRFRALQVPAIGPSRAPRFAPEWEASGLPDRYVGRGFSAASAVLVGASERGISAEQKMRRPVRSVGRFPGPLPCLVALQEGLIGPPLSGCRSGRDRLSLDDFVTCLWARDVTIRPGRDPIKLSYDISADR